MNVLVMTATISPPANAPHLLRRDPALRLTDYASALSFYRKLLGSCIDKIVFIDNSNSDVSSIAKPIMNTGPKNRVELLSFHGLDHPAEYGRGYGEFKLLDYAMENSAALTALTSQDRVWKVTGRYIVINLQRVIEKAPEHFDLYYDMKNYPMKWVDTRLMAWTTIGYNKAFRGLYHELREDILKAPAETRLYPVLRTFVGQPGVVPRFTVQPRIGGIRGYDNKNFLRGRNLLKYHIRAAARKLVPWFWV
jgi:hypothetical protein